MEYIYPLQSDINSHSCLDHHHHHADASTSLVPQHPPRKRFLAQRLTSRDISLLLLNVRGGKKSKKWTRTLQKPTYSDNKKQTQKNTYLCAGIEASQKPAFGQSDDLPLYPGH